MKNKFICILLSAILTTGILTGCRGSSETADAAETTPDYKIGIMTGTVAQGEEEYRAAEKMISKYGNMIEFVNYPDNFVKETETTISNMMQLASDPYVKAIIMCIGVPGAAAAFEKVREERPDILLMCGVSGEDPDMIAERVDIVLQADEVSMGKSIPQQAAEMGADTFVHYSFPRHMSAPMYRERRDLMKSECEKLGIKFIDETCPDPMGDLGVSGTQMFVLEDIPRKVNEYGKNTCFFNTNCSMQEPLIKASLDSGAIVAQQCCPSPFHGYPGALGISVSPDQVGDTEYIRSAISQKIADKSGTGRFSTWEIPLNMTIIEASVDYAIQYIEGNTDGINDKDMLLKSFEKSSNGKILGFSNYKSLSTGNVLDNLYLILGEYETF